MGDVIWARFGAPRKPLTICFNLRLQTVRFRSLRRGLCMLVIVCGQIVDIVPLEEDGGPPAPRKIRPRLKLWPPTGRA